MKQDIEVLDLLSQVTYDKKGFNIIGLDVQGISSMTDYFLIAEGNADRHVKAIANEIVDVMREHGRFLSHSEGLANGDWVVLDYLNIVIHLFVPELREIYRLEELWKKGKIVNLHINVSNVS